MGKIIRKLIIFPLIAVFILMFPAAAAADSTANIKRLTEYKYNGYFAYNKTNVLIKNDNIKNNFYGDIIRGGPENYPNYMTEGKIIIQNGKIINIKSSAYVIAVREKLVFSFTNDGKNVQKFLILDSNTGETKTVRVNKNGYNLCEAYKDNLYSFVAACVILEKDGMQTALLANGKALDNGKKYNLIKNMPPIYNNQKLITAETDTDTVVFSSEGKKLYTLKDMTGLVAFDYNEETGITLLVNDDYGYFSNSAKVYIVNSSGKIIKTISDININTYEELSAYFVKYMNTTYICSRTLSLDTIVYDINGNEFDTPDNFFDLCKYDDFVYSQTENKSILEFENDKLINKNTGKTITSYDPDRDWTSFYFSKYACVIKNGRINVKNGKISVYSAETGKELLHEADFPYDHIFNYDEKSHIAFGNYSIASFIECDNSLFYLAIKNDKLALVKIL